MLTSGYEVCIYGDLDFAPGAIESWRSLTLDGTLFDWPEAFAWTPSESGDTVNVGTWIEDCARYESGERLFIRIRTDDTHVRVRAILDEKEYDAYRRQIAALVRLAGTVGARGHLTLVSMPGAPFAIGYRIDVTSHGSTMKKLAEEEASHLPDRSELDHLVESATSGR